MADGRHLQNRKITISRQQFHQSSRSLAWWQILTVQSALDQRSCCLQDRLMRPKNHMLVAGAHWHIPANTTEPSVCSGQEWAVQKQLNRSRSFWGHTPVVPMNHVLDGGACWCYLLNTAAPMGGSAKTAKSFEMPFKGLTHAPATIYYLGEHIWVIWWICLNLWLYQLKGNSVYRSNTSSTYICNSTYPFIHCSRTRVWYYISTREKKPL